LPLTIRGVLVIAATATLLAVLTPRVTTRMADFEVYWTAAVRARSAEPLYRADDGHYQFKYLPPFAVVAIPAGFVPLPVAKKIWFGVSIVLLVSLVALSLALVPERRKPGWVLVAIVVVAMAKFYGHELVLGQVNLLFGVVVLLALRAMTLEREGTAGVLLALAVVVKPYAAIFAPWLLARRRLGSTVSFAIAILLLAVLPVPLYGIGGTLALYSDWWSVVTGSTEPNLTNADNVSIAGMYAKWIGDGSLVGPLAAATSLALLAAAGFAFVRRSRVPEPHVLEGALLLTLVPLLSPQGWDYVFLVSTPAIALLANYGRELPRALWIAVIAAILVVGLSLYDVMGRELYARFMALSIVTVCFIVIVAGLVVLRGRRVV
jgi:alpha-1,2-mannosyltransferase